MYGLEFDGTPKPLLIAECERCRHVFMDQPSTTNTVLIHAQTRSPLAPSGHQVQRGQAEVSAEPLCRPCAHYLRANLGKPAPLLEQFPYALADRITWPPASQQP